MAPAWKNLVQMTDTITSEKMASFILRGSFMW